ncbi:prepilin-type N-terminal cleavage/methylation domain-containing protein [Clostridiaceae bacterium 35-E11]
MLKKYNNQKGFTLLELMIIISLLIIVFIITIPRFTMDRFILKAQARELCSDIRMIRLLKMTEGKYYQIQLNKDHYKILIGIKKIKRVNFHKNIETFCNNKYISFSCQGAPTGSETADTIKIYHRKTNEFYEITIVPASGRVLLKE